LECDEAVDDQNVPDQNVLARINLKNTLKTIFKNRSCFCFPHPVTNIAIYDDPGKLESLDDSELYDKFMGKAKELDKHINENLKPIQMEGIKDFNECINLSLRKKVLLSSGRRN